MRTSPFAIAFAIAAAAALLAAAPAPGAQAPSLGAVLSAKDWLRGHVTTAEIKNKVVLVDFYTFECINCKHVEPNLRELERTRSAKGLVIISVHSPETPFERDRANLIASTAAQGITWPVIVDNDYAVWNAYGVSAWPTQLIFDRMGALRQTVVGEGQDQLVDDTIDALIADQIPANHS